LSGAIVRAWRPSFKCGLIRITRFTESSTEHLPTYANRNSDTVYLRIAITVLIPLPDTLSIPLSWIWLH